MLGLSEAPHSIPTLWDNARSSNFRQSLISTGLHAGQPLELITTEMLRYKAFEPIMILGRDKYSALDIRVRVKGGGHVAQIYAIRQALAKAIVAFYQKCVLSLPS